MSTMKRHGQAYGSYMECRWIIDHKTLIRGNFRRASPTNWKCQFPRRRWQYLDSEAPRFISELWTTGYSCIYDARMVKPLLHSENELFIDLIFFDAVLERSKLAIGGRAQEDKKRELWILQRACGTVWVRHRWCVQSHLEKWALLYYK